MKVAACQLADLRGGIQRALSLIETYVADAEQEGAQLVCFPECFLQGYDLQPEHVADVAIDLKSSEFAAVLGRIAERRPVVVLGLIERDGDDVFNAAVAVERGRLVATYRKTHLLKGERAVFRAGSDYPVFDVGGVGVGINICHDLCFEEAVAGLRAAGARLVVCPCNNMMPPELAEEWKFRHNAIRSQRARESGVWLVSSDVTGTRSGRISYGPTAVIDPRGNVVAQVPLMKEGMLVVTLDQIEECYATSCA